MLHAFEIMFNGVWSLLSIPLPIDNDVNFTLWQYFMFLTFLIVILRQLFNKSSNGGK